MRCDTDIGIMHRCTDKVHRTTFCASLRRHRPHVREATCLLGWSDEVRGTTPVAPYPSYITWYVAPDPAYITRYEAPQTTTRYSVTSCHKQQRRHLNIGAAARPE